MRLNSTITSFITLMTCSLENLSGFLKDHKHLILKLIFLSLLLLKLLSLRGEGSKELMADTSCRAALSTVDGTFAAYNSSLPGNEKTRLFIHIANPATEVVYLGFSRGYATGNSDILGEASTSYRPVYYFRIKDPSGNVVFGPQAVDINNAIPVGVPGFQQVKTGAAPIYGSGGYTPFIFTPAAGAPQGDYYIEFNTDPVNFSSSQCSFDYWDITVADLNNPSSPIAIPGRIWAYQWGFYSKSYSAGGYTGVFKGKLFSYTPEGFVNLIDFGNSDFRGGSFLIGMNSTGPGTSGNPVLDRQSVYNAAIVGNEYKLFINDPDVTLYPTGDATVPSLTINNMGFLPASCYATEIPISFNITRAGKVDILMDFDGNGKFDVGTRDVVISTEATTGSNTIIWDKKDGLGNTVTDPELLDIIVKIKYELGIHHLSLSDIEYMTKGFTVTPVRPLIAAGYVSKFYWDDTRIKNSPGNQVPYITGPQPNVVELEGATERKWDNFTSSSTAGFGNKNSINTWWNSYQSLLTSHFVFTECGTLALKIKEFSAVPDNQVVLLNWQVLDESDISRFEIEYSVDGIHFAKTYANIPSGAKSYSISDANAVPGINYYRLKVINKSGAFIYSDVRKTVFSGSVSIKIFPNPATDFLHINLGREGSKRCQIRIISTDGSVVTQKFLTPVSTMQKIDIRSLRKGNYYCQIITDTDTFVQQVIKN